MSMKKLFYFGIIGLTLFEILNVYFIMPMPGSQVNNTLDFAYFLYSYRWLFRIIFAALSIYGAISVFQSKSKWKWLAVLPILIALAVTYLFNFKMSADKMFRQVSTLSMKSNSDNKLPANAIVLGINYKGIARAYPMRFLIYHHQVIDTIAGEQMMITYCSVCRTGRVYQAKVNGKNEKFRLVGMDHFNAMFEDESTKSWWRQVNGQAVTGSLKGSALPEYPAMQVNLDKWLELYPESQIMQADEDFMANYDIKGKYESGMSKSSLTGTDSLSWNNKSWVIGVKFGNISKAYDWNELKGKGVINDIVDNKPISIVISNDKNSFIAFERIDNNPITISNDTLNYNAQKYDFAGRNLSKSGASLNMIKSYQEFWHSWKTFNPNTLVYKD